MNVIPLSCLRAEPQIALLAVEPLVDSHGLSLQREKWSRYVASYRVVCDAWQEVEGIADFLFRKGHLDLSLLYAWMESAITEGLSDMQIRCFKFPAYPCLDGATIPTTELEMEIGDVGKATMRKLAEDHLIDLELIRLARCATRVELRPLR